MNYFTRIPNRFIRCDIRKEYGLSRNFYLIYTHLDTHRSVHDVSWITMKKLFSYYNYKMTKKKPSVFQEMINILKFMANNGMIEYSEDLDKISYTNGVEIKIIPDKFDATDKFTMLTTSDFEKITNTQSVVDTDNLLLCYLYICSYMPHKVKNNTNKNETTFPETFYGNLHNMSKELSMSTATINNCLKTLVDIGLLKKRVTGNVIENEKSKHLPNIYALNKDGYEQELELTYQKLMKKYRKED